jgi:hypothetical protein
VVTTSCVVAGADGAGGETELSLREEKALVTGVDSTGNVSTVGTPGEEEMARVAELPMTGAVGLSPDAPGVDGFGAIHFVQMVETTVSTTVETVNELWIISLVPEVTVFVTGQVVRVV